MSKSKKPPVHWHWKTIDLGVHSTGIEILTALKEKGYEVSFETENILKDDNFSVAPKGTTLHVQPVLPKTWGRDSLGRQVLEGSFYEDILATAAIDSFKKLTVEAAMQFFLQQTKQDWMGQNGHYPCWGVVVESTEKSLLTFEMEGTIMPSGRERILIRARTSHWPNTRYTKHIFVFSI